MIHDSWTKKSKWLIMSNLKCKGLLSRSTSFVVRYFRGTIVKNNCNRYSIWALYLKSIWRAILIFGFNWFCCPRVKVYCPLWKQARKPRSYVGLQLPPTNRLTGIKCVHCTATSVAKKIICTVNDKIILLWENLRIRHVLEIFQLPNNTSLYSLPFPGVFLPSSLIKNKELRSIEKIRSFYFQRTHHIRGVGSWPLAFGF